jgi:hypothetical protein
MNPIGLAHLGHLFDPALQLGVAMVTRCCLDFYRYSGHYECFSVKPNADDSRIVIENLYPTSIACDWMQDWACIAQTLNPSAADSSLIGALVWSWDYVVPAIRNTNILSHSRTLFQLTVLPGCSPDTLIKSSWAFFLSGLAVDREIRATCICHWVSGPGKHPSRDAMKTGIFC